MLPTVCVSVCVSLCVLHRSVILAVTQTPVKGQLKPFITSEPVGLMHLRDPISRGPVSGPEAHTDFFLLVFRCVHTYAYTYVQSHVHARTHAT